jgi:hypothetical protein
LFASDTNAKKLMNQRLENVLGVGPAELHPVLVEDPPELVHDLDVVIRAASPRRDGEGGSLMRARVVVAMVLVVSALGHRIAQGAEAERGTYGRGTPAGFPADPRGLRDTGAVGVADSGDPVLHTDGALTPFAASSALPSTSTTWGR